MKKNSIIFILLFTAISQAQVRNGRRIRDFTQPTQQKAPEPNFNIKVYLGIIEYDIKKAAKKSSIKINSDEGKKFSKILTVYNKRTKDIARINSFLLSSTKELIENHQKHTKKTGDYSNQTKVQLKMAENLKPISETLKKEDKQLDKSIKELLSEKKYKKWIKYNKRIYKIFPEE